MAEISGRLLSIAADIAERAHAEAAAINKPGIRFRHVMYIKVSTVRQDPNWDVYAEPADDDPAHANMVAYSLANAQQLLPTDDRISHDFVLGVAKAFEVCDASDLSPLEQLRRA